MDAASDQSARPRIIIVVPCYNESKRLAVDEFRRFVETSDVHIAFVDDGSTDNTVAVLETLKAQCGPRVSVLRSPKNQGKAEAVRTGMRHALSRGPAFAGYWDADLATPLAAIHDFMQVFSERPEIDMVFGSRVKLLGRSIERKAVRHYLGRTFATTVSIALQLPIYDTQCGAKIFRVSERTQPMFEHPFLSRWVFDVELIARYIQIVGSTDGAAKHIYEYPLHSWADIGGSKVKPSDFFVAFWDVVRIHRKYHLAR